MTNPLAFDAFIAIRSPKRNSACEVARFAADKGRPTAGDDFPPAAGLAEKAASAGFFLDLLLLIFGIQPLRALAAVGVASAALVVLSVRGTQLIAGAT